MDNGTIKSVVEALATSTVEVGWEMIKVGTHSSRGHVAGTWNGDTPRPKFMCTYEAMLRWGRFARAGHTMRYWKLIILFLLHDEEFKPTKFESPGILCKMLRRQQFVPCCLELTPTRLKTSPPPSPGVFRDGPSICQCRSLTVFRCMQHGQLHCVYHVAEILRVLTAN